MSHHSEPQTAETLIKQLLELEAQDQGKAKEKTLTLLLFKHQFRQIEAWRKRMQRLCGQEVSVNLLLRLAINWLSLDPIFDISEPPSTPPVSASHKQSPRNKLIVFTMSTRLSIETRRQRESLNWTNSQLAFVSAMEMMNHVQVLIELHAPSRSTPGRWASKRATNQAKQP
jgi:hypothetical protein